MGILKEIFSWWGGNTWGTRFLLWRQGRLVGTDEFGNSYYEQKSRRGGSRTPARRWVTYKSLSEPSQIPPSWHGWLHFTTNEIPLSRNTRPRPWEKAHHMNLTGSASAYRPYGSILRNRKANAEEKKGYESWQPNE